MWHNSILLFTGKSVELNTFSMIVYFIAAVVKCFYHNKAWWTVSNEPFFFNLTSFMPSVCLQSSPFSSVDRFIFETNVQLDNGGNCEKCFQGLHIVLSHHLKSCQYPQRSIDLLGLFEGPKLYSLLIDYVDSLCRIWMGCLCHDIRPWQQSHLFMRLHLLLWILKRASWLPEASCKWMTILDKWLISKAMHTVRTFLLKSQF